MKTLKRIILNKWSWYNFDGVIIKTDLVDSIFSDSNSCSMHIWKDGELGVCFNIWRNKRNFKNLKLFWIKSMSWLQGKIEESTLNRLKDNFLWKRKCFWQSFRTCIKTLFGSKDQRIWRLKEFLTMQRIGSKIVKSCKLLSDV